MPLTASKPNEIAARMNKICAMLGSFQCEYHLTIRILLAAVDIELNHIASFFHCGNFHTWRILRGKKYFTICVTTRTNHFYYAIRDTFRRRGSCDILRGLFVYFL